MYTTPPIYHLFVFNRLHRFIIRRLYPSSPWLLPSPPLTLSRHCSAKVFFGLLYYQTAPRSPSLYAQRIIYSLHYKYNAHSSILILRPSMYRYLFISVWGFLILIWTELQQHLSSRLFSILTLQYYWKKSKRE